MFGLSNLPSYGLSSNVTTINNIKSSLVERFKENVENVLHSNREIMKWSSSSSSLSSMGDHRKSIFYTDPATQQQQHNLLVNEKMNHDNETTPTMTMSDLRTKLQTTEENLDMQVRKCENLIVFFTNQIKTLTVELENEKSWRVHQLSKIVKALLYFETKLKNEQKQIKHQLYEKDNEINRLYREVLVLKERYGDQSTDIDVSEVAQYCTACRKQYYLLETKNVGVQVHHHRNFGDKDNSPTLSVEYLSTTEEELTGSSPSFAEARCSKRYQSKRTSGTFRDYLRSRNNELQTECNNNNNVNNSCGTTTVTDAIVNNNNNDDEENHIKHNTNNYINNENNEKINNDINLYNNDNAGDGDDIEKVINIDSNCNNNRKKKKLFQRSSMRDSYSSYINNMHGFRLRSNSEQYLSRNNNCNSIDLNSPVSRSSNDDEEDKDESVKNSTNSNTFLKKYDTKDSSKLQFDSTEDWYASASDMDDSDSGLSKPYGYNAVNPVLECVNQILLQQSMDGTMETHSSPAPSEVSPPKESRIITPPSAITTSSSSTTTNSRQRRVHFSTQNSMVQVPSSDCLSFQSSKDSQQLLGYEIVYSNEYEPIGSSNHYVDMESKLGQEDIIGNGGVSNLTNNNIEKIKIPPALPPKPANLLKLRHVLKTSAPSSFPPPQTKSSAESIDTETEPDYCSISEVNETITKNLVKIVADVHNNDASSTTSEDAKTDITDESFADIPKLPNVADIISPKKKTVNKFIAQDNYITNKLLAQSEKLHHQKLPHKPIKNNKLIDISNSKILEEINTKKSILSSMSAPIIRVPIPTKMFTINEQVPKQPASQPTIIIPENKMQIHAEFDWYNLDAEYGKFGQSQIIRNNNEDDHHHDVEQGEEFLIDSVENNLNLINKSNELSVEYNLDEEFILTNPAEINEKDVCIDNKTIDTDNADHHKSLPLKTTFGTLESATPQKTFDYFLKETGLTSKPLPRKRKVYYSAPFV